MGKCLSCCEEPDYAGPNQRIKPGEADKSDLGRAPRGNNPLSALDSRRLSATGDANNKGNGKGAAGATAEKRMFYSRIPPILSGSGDSKRSSHGRGEISEAKINALFEQYKDPNEDSMLSEGIERFCHDLDVKPEEFKVLVLAWKFGAETMCRFSRSEFVGGCKALRVDSLRGLQGRFPEMLQDVDDPDRFKDLYRFAFKFGLDVDVGQRILPSDMAVGLWKLVFHQREPPILSRWLDFLENHPNIRGIPRDTWNMFLNFCEAVNDDLSTYDDTEAWPSLFDDFVEFENDQTNQNIQKDSKDESE